MSITDHLKECTVRIGNMCGDHRPPRMSIPVCADDDDIFITTTCLQAAKEIDNLKAQLESELAAHESWQREHLRTDGEQCRQIRGLEAKCDAMRATLRAVLVDAQAQDVLFEWWSVIGHFLVSDDPLRTVGKQND